MRRTQRMNLFLLILLFGMNSIVWSQQDDISIKVVGKATYGEGTPFNLALETWGSDNNWKLYDQLRALHDRWPEKWKIGLSDTNTRSIPTNNYWSGMIFQENNSWGGKNWFYPGTIEFDQNGTQISFPDRWNDVGSAMDGGWSIVVEPEDQREMIPTSCVVNDWSDWLVEAKLTDGTKEMYSTFAQGMPFVWFETSYNHPTIKIHDAPYTSDGVNEITNWPYTGNVFVGTTSGRKYAVFLPDNTVISKDGNRFSFDFSGNERYFIVGLLKDANDLELLKTYAYNKPLKTRVDWDYQPEVAEVRTKWTIETENLKGLPSEGVLQGFLPHHYQHVLENPEFLGLEYLTAKGISKYAVGDTFEFAYRFTGVVPHIGAPVELQNNYSFDSTYLADKIEEASNRGAMGQDIYWGLKPLGRQTKYLAMAHETNHPKTEKLRQVCRQAFDDWFTYTPGETEHCFYRYDDDSNLDALVGFDPGGYSATFTDHDMCYGYMFYSAALYAMYHPELLDDYGDFLVLLSKQINNWDRDDKDYPFFRLFEPWTGHNWAGGTGGGGNNVESLSEGMQSWAGMFILGELMGNDEMRDAAAFGYSSMSRCFDQYYRDRDGINFSGNFTADVAAMLWTSGPAYGNYVGNEANYWMNWISYSPAMNYMYSDLTAAQSQYESFANIYNGNSGNWGSDFWNNLNMYVMGFDAELAAVQRQQNAGRFEGHDLNGISYYYLQANRYLGRIDWGRHCSEPLSQVYYNDALNQYTYVCYNPNSEEIEVTAYNGGTVIGTFKVPPHQLIQTHLDEVLSAIQIVSERVLTAGYSEHLSVKGLDQYGAEIALFAQIEWEVVHGLAEVNSNGEVKAMPEASDSIVVRVRHNGLVAYKTIYIGEPRKVSELAVLPVLTRIEKGGVVYFSAETLDQYGEEIDVEVEWSVNGGGVIETELGLFQSDGTLGTFIVTAKAQEIQFQSTVVVYEPADLIDNIALNRPSQASSKTENAQYANDGNDGNQWQSNSVPEDGGLEPHWWMVELDNVYDIHDLEIIWDVSASIYTIQYSLDGVAWLTADSITGSSWWSTDELDMYSKGVTAKYLRVYCYQHAQDYGYAIKEFKAFGEVSTGPGPLATLVVNPTEVENLAIGMNQQFEVHGYDVNGNVVELSGVWSVNQGGVMHQTGVFEAEEIGGPVEVRYEDQGLIATAFVTVVAPKVTHVASDYEMIKVTCSPNPVMDYVGLTGIDLKEVSSVELIDCRGVKKQLRLLAQEWDVSDFQPGEYTVLINLKNGNQTVSRFMKL